MTGIKDVKTSFKAIHLASPLSKTLEGEIEKVDLIHLVIRAEGTYQHTEYFFEEHQEQSDRAGDLPEIRRALWFLFCSNS